MGYACTHVRSVKLDLQLQAVDAQPGSSVLELTAQLGLQPKTWPLADCSCLVEDKGEVLERQLYQMVSSK